jgi:hypothetical protein
MAAELTKQRETHKHCAEIKSKEMTTDPLRSHKMFRWEDNEQRRLGIEDKEPGRARREQRHLDGGKKGLVSFCDVSTARTKIYMVLRFEKVLSCLDEHSSCCCNAPSVEWTCDI